MITLYNTWTNIKSFVDNFGEELKYIESSDLYIIYVIHNKSTHKVEIWKDTSKISGIDETQNNLDLAEFVNDYKSNSTGSYSELKVANVGSQNVESIKSDKNNYKCSTIVVTESEQELDLENTYSDFNIMVTGNNSVILKLNSNTNDEIPMLGGANIRDIIGSDSFALDKIYYKTSTGDSEILFWGIR